MTRQVDLDEIETTRAEKLLAVVLAGFLALGAIWIYVRLEEPFRSDTSYEQVLAERPTDASAIRAADAAAQELGRTQGALAEAERDLEVDREAYRTALEAGQPTDALRRAYEQAQTSLARTERNVATAESRERATRAPAEQARQRVDQELQRLLDSGRLSTFLARLGLAALALVAGFAAFNRLRRHRSRYLPVGYAAIGASTLLVLVLTGDYLTDYFDVTDLGPLVLSLLGVALSLASFVGLQRYLERRIPVRRVRRHECPFCGFPVGENARCEGCGREVIAACTTCDSPRRVGTTHCGTCGHM